MIIIIRKRNKKKHLKFFNYNIQTYVKLKLKIQIFLFINLTKKVQSGTKKNVKTLKFLFIKIYYH